MTSDLTSSDKIELTLTPAAPKAPEFPAFQEMPEVPVLKETGSPAGQEGSAITGGDGAKYMQDVVLTPEEQKIVDDFASQIDIANSDIVMSYGAASQQKIADFSDSALEGVKAKDLGQIGDMITSLVTELKEDPTKSKGFLGLFKVPASLEKIKAKYATTQQNVDKISKNLSNHQTQLIKDTAMLDELYKTNINYYKELTMYILAGKKALEKAKNETLPLLQQKAKETALAEDAQAAADFEGMINRFEKKLYDLELTRTISMQMAPQIRLIQNNDVTMAEKIQSTLVNTIPLWKNQLVLALSLAHSQGALQAEKQVTDLTNELLKKNAETLKQGSIDIARESERAVVDMETIRETNQKLIDSLTEVTKIQAEGREKRAAAEKELAQIEADLKGKLLELSTLQK